MSFATPADLKTRYDERLLGQLVRDDGTKASSTALDTDTILQAALDDAAGDIVSACIVGQRYSEDDLNSLAGYSLDHLKRINCDVAMRYLADRRVHAKANEAIERIMERGEKYIKRLQDGETLFNLTAQVAAAVPKVAGPTTQTLRNLNSITRRTRNFYPDEILPGNR